MKDSIEEAKRKFLNAQLSLLTSVIILSIIEVILLTYAGLKYESFGYIQTA